MRRRRRLALRLVPQLLSLRHRPMAWPTYSAEFAAWAHSASDPVRWSTIALALHTLDSDGVPGAIGELGVHRGDLSVVLHHLSPKRELYLFDTFTGFPDRDGDHRFQDTSVEFVRSRFPASTRVHIRAGVFPESAFGLDGAQFAFAMLDADRYQAILDGLEFFYPRMARSGYVFIHDYNSPEFNHGAMNACREFLADKSERLVEVPDRSGSAVLRVSAS